MRSCKPGMVANILSSGVCNYPSSVPKRFGRGLAFWLSIASYNDRVYLVRPGRVGEAVELQTPSAARLGVKILLHPKFVPLLENSSAKASPYLVAVTRIWRNIITTHGSPTIDLRPGNRKHQPYALSLPKKTIWAPRGLFLAGPQDGNMVYKD